MRSTASARSRAAWRSCTGWVLKYGRIDPHGAGGAPQRGSGEAPCCRLTKPTPGRV
jgi:hypothetical protein